MMRLCECGCGQPVGVAKITNRGRGAVKGKPNRFLPRHQFRRSGAASPHWRGGRVVGPDGYVLIYAPDHPRARTGKGRGYAPEHLLVVERALGHFLDRRHPIHHVDENRSNNANGNLVACEDNAYHMLLHQRQRALDATGNANALSCRYCGTYDRQDELYVHTRRSRGQPRGAGRVAFHRDCHSRYELERLARRKAS